MLTCEYAGPAFGEPRSHPWIDSVGKPECRYYDLRATPGHIRCSLEDFVPWKQHAAIETFYVLLEKLNAPNSALESNDCSFEGFVTNEHTSFDKALQCSGRVMVLFRQLERNTAAGQIDWLETELHLQLAAIDPKFRWGIVGTSVIPVRYLALPELREQQLGTQLMISFWAWGNTEPEGLLNLGRLMKNLAQGLTRLGAAAAASS